MMKLSKLKDEQKVIDENSNIYTVEEVKEDLKYFKDKEKRLYTTTEYHASVDAASFIDAVFDCIYENGMYEDWDQKIKEDVTEDDVKKIQLVFDEILSRNKSQNIAYYQDASIEVDI